ncbi:hypothetical protein C8034_v009380 [Colletotrichum sidae]|uniref:Uncharacterized protein n=2 Tax=Colletotrichum orbiculare species complex TaxID=2707354 RepID=N4W315_COLOR|nr:hypothetical protein Cob_v003712 [Colletotrichum orbiculare MAFF 240422]TEA19599.1 hypothetical protein C8034_v009380 [Colletotrichum sidae]
MSNNAARNITGELGQVHRSNGPRNFGQKIPERFQCKVGGEWKPWSGFSKRQQKLVQDKLSKNQRIDPTRTGMVCRIHSGEPVKEIQCEGPCNLVRPLDDYSKNNRTNGVFICKPCQHWTNSQEPGYAPVAAPQNMRDPFEEADDFDNRLPTEPSDIFDFSQEDGKPVKPPIEGYSSRYAGLGGPSSGPATGRSQVARRSDENTISTQRTTASVLSENNDPSLLGESMANMWLSSTHERETIEHNAWDNTGRRYVQNKAPTTASGRGSSVAGSALPESTASRGVRPGMNHAPRRLNTNLGAAQQDRPIMTGGRSGFGTAAERQNDRKPVSKQEQRDLQRGLPPRAPPVYMAYQDDDGEDETSD